MAVSLKDYSYFQRIGQAFGEAEEERSRRMAEMEPGKKIELGVQISDAGICIGAAARGSLMSATSVPEEQLLAQGSLPHLWRTRISRE